MVRSGHQSKGRVPTRRSRRLAGLTPASNPSSSSMIPDGLGSAASDVVGSSGASEGRSTGERRSLLAEMTQRAPSEAPTWSSTVSLHPSHVRRFSDPMLGEGTSSGTSSLRQGTNSTTSQEHAAGSSTADVAGTSSLERIPSTSSGSLIDIAGGSDAGRSRGRRGAIGRQRHPAGQGGLLRTTAEQFGTVPVQGESFCRCPQQGQSRDLHCSCGEEDQAFEWTWDRDNKSVAAEVSESEREVRFHVNYSSGTAAIRGTQPMSDRQYFWEVKMTTPVYGTDMMVGVGTANVDVDAYRYNFCSILGHDAESWGLSYYGKAQSRGVFTNVIGARFGQGSIIGVHLDTWLGRVLFYKNRKPLGEVFTGLRGKTLYPMVSSTAARTGMKLIKACSYSTSLQFLCCCTLRKLVPPHLDVTAALHLPPGLHDFLVNNLGWLLRPSELGGGDSLCYGIKRSHAASAASAASAAAAAADDDSSSDEDESPEQMAVKRRKMMPPTDGLSDFDDDL